MPVKYQGSAPTYRVRTDEPNGAAANMLYQENDTEWLQAKLDEVDWDVKRDLVEILKADHDSWKELVAVLPKWLTNNKISVHQLESVESPELALIVKLEEYGFTVAELISCLETLNMEDALMIIKITPDVELQITNDLPESETVEVGKQLHLVCKATGFPRPFYKWFKDGQELPEHQSSTLSLDNVSMSDAAEYYCKVYNIDRLTIEERQNPRYSRRCTVIVTEAFPQSSLPDLSGRPPEIVLQPLSPGDFLPAGFSFILDCRAAGDSPLSYQWFKDNQELSGETERELPIRHLFPDEGTGKNSWKYFCSVTNPFGKAVTETVTVGLSISGENLRFTAKDKVALLIANERYQEMESFTLPSSDVASLSKILKHLGFRVMSYLDLNLNGMKNAAHHFCQELYRGVYGFFYFAGHGFEYQGQSFMQPVDASKNCRFEENVCVDSVASAMQEHEPAMSFFLLDMCRERPVYDSNSHRDQMPPHVYQKKRYKNTVIGYATSFLADAIEVDGHPNGLFVQYLKKHLADKKSICEILLAVIQDMSNDKVAQLAGQDPCVQFNIKEARSLRDPILNAGPENIIFEEKWNRIYECPAARRISVGPYQFWVTFKPHKDTFCNAIDIVFCLMNEPLLDHHQISIHFEAVEANIVSIRRDTEVLVTIRDLQLLKQPLSYTLMIQENESEELARYSDVIDFPGIASLELTKTRLSDTFMD